MKTIVLLDSGPLGSTCNIKLTKQTQLFANFLKKEKIVLAVPEIIAYEIRRNFLLEGLSKSIRVLDKYNQRDQFIPLGSEDLILAAELWAWCRKTGKPTTSNARLDIDVILMAQALSQKNFFDEVIIATQNPKHLYLFHNYEISIWEWGQALLDCKRGAITLFG
ncbi:MAG: hypothetical protein WA902_24835 [Thermosynechococcaceae cyanobacterium]